jgi:hypothetical protein
MTSRQRAMLAIFIGPAACAADQIVSYALVYRAATARGGNGAAFAATAVTAIVVLMGVCLSWSAIPKAHRSPRGESVVGVDRFLAIAGVATNLFFLLVVVVGFGLPQWFLRPVD